MTIWIIALVFLAALGIIGYYQGAIRVGMSLLGLLVAMMASIPLGSLFHPLLSMLGVKNPYFEIFLGPVVPFLLILIAFKIGAFFLHRKIVEWYRRNQPEFKYLLWEQLNSRLGACLGVVNAALYTFLIATVIYVLGYLTVQVSRDEDPFLLRTVTKAARELNSSGVNRIAGFFNPMPARYYQAVDILGHLYRDPLLQARMARYPGFFALAERAEFQTLSKDTKFNEMLQSQVPVREVVNYEAFRTVLDSEEIKKELMKLDLPDLLKFLRTGESKYNDEKILGRWKVDPNNQIRLMKAINPKISYSQMKQIKEASIILSKYMTLIVTPENKVMMKGPAYMKQAKPGVAPKVPSPDPKDPLALFKDQDIIQEGEWKKEDEKYKVTMAQMGMSATVPAEIVGNTLVLNRGPFEQVYIRED